MLHSRLLLGKSIVACKREYCPQGRFLYDDQLPKENSLVLGSAQNKINSKVRHQGSCIPKLLSRNGQYASGMGEYNGDTALVRCIPGLSAFCMAFSVEVDVFDVDEA
jgi:hypothetical protein